MLRLPLVNGPKFDRNATAPGRRPARIRRPLAEPMEDRCLMAAPPFMLISDVTLVEGTSGVKDAVFTVRLNLPTTSTVTVDYRTSDVTATAGADYHGVSGRLTFAPRETLKTIAVPLVCDAAVEPVETFRVTLSGATNAMLIKPVGVGTIQDDDTPIVPELSTAGVTMTRGLSGSRLMTFTVNLSTAASTPVSVTLKTRNLTAIAGVDYVAKQETLTFAPGQTSKQFAVTIFGRSTPTSDKIFYVDLSGASVALKVKIVAGILRYGA